MAAQYLPDRHANHQHGQNDRQAGGSRRPSTERQRAESAGCDLFLTKPCLPDELLREVHLLLASSKIGTRWERPAKADLREKPDARRNPG